MLGNLFSHVNQPIVGSAVTVSGLTVALTEIDAVGGFLNGYVANFCGPRVWSLKGENLTAGDNALLDIDMNSFECQDADRPLSLYPPDYADEFIVGHS